MTPTTMDTSTVSPAMATTAMVRTGFCSLEATVTAGGKRSWSPCPWGRSQAWGSPGVRPPASLGDNSPAAPGCFSPSSQQLTFRFGFQSSSWCNQSSVQGSAAGVTEQPLRCHTGFVNQR